MAGAVTSAGAGRAITGGRWRAILSLLLLPALALAAGCAGLAPPPRPAGGLLFPPPPAQARVLFLGSISTPADLPAQRGGFARFILGPEPARYPLVKPIAACLGGSWLYVCDTVMNTVFIYDLRTGEAGLLPGDRGNGKIQQPNNLALAADGTLYVADSKRGAVLVYGPAGDFVGALGRPAEAAPVDVAVGERELFVCDLRDNEIEVWSRADGSLLRRLGGLGGAPGRFHWPSQVELGPDGNLYVSDTGNFRVQKLTPNGEPLASFGGNGTGLGQFAMPKGIALDGDGRLYVADARFANVQIFGPGGELLLFFGGPGPDRGNLDLPAGVSAVPWPAGVAWLDERVTAEFDPAYLVTVVSQKGAGMVNFFAVAAGP